MPDDQRVQVIVDGRRIRCDMHDGPDGPLYSMHVLPVMPAHHASSHDNEHDEAGLV